MIPDFVREPKAIQAWDDTCELSGQEVTWFQKELGALRGVYAHPEAIDAMDEHMIAYKVANQNFHPNDAVVGNLEWGTTYLYPYTVAGECSMTHGHVHMNHDCDEYYYGLTGEGFLLFWDGADDFYTEKIYPGSLHYISGKYAHRIINSGDTMLAVAACYLPSSIQNHAIIETTPFPYRCFKRNGALVWEEA